MLISLADPTDVHIYRIFQVGSFMLGACIASFLNVVIWRVPRGESIVSPQSHCPKCNAPIKWYQNLPIVSYLALRGKCANCHAPISPRYILIEMLGGILFLAVFMQHTALLPSTALLPTASDASLFALRFLFAFYFSLLVLFTWISLMIVGTFIDFDHKLLPDFVTIGGMVLGLVYNGVQSFVFHSTFYILHSLFGLALGFGLLWLVRFLGTKAFKREAMGVGDVLLMGAVGAMFGPMAVFFTLTVSSLLGSIVGITLIALAKTRFGRYTEIPYGPYICASCLIWMFFGNFLLSCLFR